ncbi:hypothetical protein I3760_03G133700 [Carya illinoinensis]|uniref:Uncharacterized protein n=1 Tax=Carya illinoinensis TaxID=32201 RepID=A0A8T1R221_CARIL|nr:hypothetical protein I3760_03G133700 [Carya illinoinensis]KAG6660936.1 hypothetical protein CIPAW_03G139600 [Carya illinoinensis]
MKENIEKVLNHEEKIELSLNKTKNLHSQRSKNFACKALPESFAIQDFELDKIYGVGSYSKALETTWPIGIGGASHLYFSKLSMCVGERGDAERI